jgi:signal transduction histidine kinase
VAESAADISDRKEQEEGVRRSRARIVAAADEARRRLERNLHDGAQQRLMSVLLFLRLARSKTQDTAIEAVYDRAIDELAEGVKELRELARGIHSEVLTRRGLAAALRVMTQRSPVPVECDIAAERYPEHVEAAAYYVVSESLANVVKYARASKATMNVSRMDDRLVVEIADDGVGGADATAGTGLRGLGDRVAALDGTFDVASPPAGGTCVRAEIPLG